METQPFDSVTLKVVQRARDAFLREGYSRLTMTALADACGLTRRGLYKHFKSKEDLFRATLRLQNAEAFEAGDWAAKKALARGGTALIVILAWLDTRFGETRRAIARSPYGTEVNVMAFEIGSDVMLEVSKESNARVAELVAAGNDAAFGVEQHEHGRMAEIGRAELLVLHAEHGSECGSDERRQWEWQPDVGAERSHEEAGRTGEGELSEGDLSGEAHHDDEGEHHDRDDHAGDQPAAPRTGGDHQPGGAAVDPVDGHQRLDPQLALQTHQQRLLHVLAARDHGQKVRLVGHHQPVVAEQQLRLEGHGGLVALNHDSPDVAEHVADVMTHWLGRGVDGWRLDAVYAVPAEFWRRVLPRVRAAHPEAWVLGEMIHGDYARYVAESGIDSVTQYELWKAMWSSIVDLNLFELAWALQRHDAFAAQFLPYTFVGNHDVTRLASTVTDSRHVTHALAVLFFVAGTPSVYAGDEQGFRGVKEERVGGDDAIRPAFPASPGDLAPDGWPLYREHQRLIGFRRRYPWLAHARLEVVHVENERLVLAATSPEGERLVLTLNLGDDPFAPALPPAELVLRSGEELAPSAPQADLVVGPHSWAICR